MVKKERKWLGRIYLALDMAAAEAAFFTAIILRYGSFYPIPPFFNSFSYLFYAVLLSVLYLPVLWAFGIGRERVPSVLSLFKSAFILFVLANVLPFYFQEYAFSRIVFLSFGVLALFYGLAWRFAVQLVLDTPWGLRLFRERVLLAARADRLAPLAAALGNVFTGRYEIVSLAAEGTVNNGAEKALETLGLSADARGQFEEAEGLAVKWQPDVIFLDPEGIKPRLWLGLAEKLADNGFALRLLPGLEPPFVVQSGPVGVAEGLELVTEPIAGFQAMVKRLMDIVVSLVVLLAASPLLLIIALAIKLKSPGPVILSQERVGRDGVVFRIYKFRTMVPEAEWATGPVWSSDDDQRVIGGLGRFLRRTGLDELPQFWNILTGSMSLIGPRPERAYFFDSYPELYRGRLAVRPGLTGLAQVICRSTTLVEQKVRHDLYYIRNYSLGLDIEILWRTTVMLIREEWRVLFGRMEGLP